MAGAKSTRPPGLPSAEGCRLLPLAHRCFFHASQLLDFLPIKTDQQVHWSRNTSESIVGCAPQPPLPTIYMYTHAADADAAAVAPGAYTFGAAASVPPVSPGPYGRPLSDAFGDLVSLGPKKEEPAPPPPR